MNLQKKSSLKLNAFFNISRILLNLLIPLLTFPYTVRILNPAGLGKVNFVASISSYFMLLASLGIPLYGIKEISAVRNDIEKRTSVFIELLILNLIFVIFSSLCLFVLVMSISRFAELKYFFVIFALMPLFLAFGVDWFFQGIENYRYLAILNFIFRPLSVVFLFCFVKTENDLYAYAFYQVLVTVGTNIINIVFIGKFIKLNKSIKINIKKHIKPLITISMLEVSLNLYLYIDKVLLGFIGTDYDVGIYTTANVIAKICIMLITSIGGVLIPRLSYYKNNNENALFLVIIKKYFSLVVFLGVPAALGMIILSKNIIYIFAGQKYFESILTLRILAIWFFFAVLTNFSGYHILYLYKKEKVVVYSILCGIVLCLLMSLYFVPRIKSAGEALSMLCSQVVIVFIQFLYIRIKFKNILFFDKNQIKYIISALLMCGVVFVLKRSIATDYRLFDLVVLVFFGAACYLTTNTLMRDANFVMPFITILKLTILKRLGGKNDRNC